MPWRGNEIPARLMMNSENYPGWLRPKWTGDTNYRFSHDGEENSLRNETSLWRKLSRQ